MKFKANIVGTDALLKKFERFGKEGEQAFKQTTHVAAEAIKEGAKQRAVVGTPESTGIKGYKGKELRQSIFNKPTKGIYQRIYSTVKYAPYVEFGTGGKVDIPKGWEEIARAFKGKGIKKIDLPARPFMYPAFVKGSKDYLKDLEKQLNKLTKKFNK